MAGFDIWQNDRRDQEPGDNEEYIHADEATADAGHASVKEDHGDNCYSPETVDIGSVPKICFLAVRARTLHFKIRRWLTGE